MAALAKQLGFAPVKLGKLYEGGALLHARGRAWGQSSNLGMKSQQLLGPIRAVRAALKRRPGLILSDIQLADGSSGLDAVNEILVSQEVPVIFITGYPELFLTGQAPELAFLITKPFTVDSVKAVISQALFFKSKGAMEKAAEG